MLFRLEEWQSSSGIWYCQHLDKFTKGTQLWVVPARILGISADQFIQLLVDKYEPDYLWRSEDKNTVCWGWKSQTKMRKYKNEINAAARKVGFQV